MLDTIYRILAMPLTWFYDFTGSYVVAMILYAVLIKIVLFPFGIKQQKNMVRQASIRPKEQAIRDRYKGRDDRKTRMKMQEELQKLYQEEGYNPMSGCGPMLIQLPIIWILYRIIYKPISYILGASGTLIASMVEKANSLVDGAKFSASSEIQWINVINDHFDEFKSVVGEQGGRLGAVFADKAAFDGFFDGFNVCGVNLINAPSKALNADFWSESGALAAIILIAIPVLTFASQFLSMKIVRKMTYQPVQDAQTAASMKIMDFVFPAMTLYMAFVLPGMLGIYWIVNSLLSIVQQVALKEMFPMPVFTEEDYKAAARAMNGKAPKAKKPAAKKNNPNSLHHIDDDDDDTVESSVKEKEETAEKKSAGKRNPLIEPAPEKDAEEKSEKPESDSNE